ncbi:MAG: histidine phosphatase family protein [Saprospiraceae bacterium]|nr:histidine phosphatase family protein [Saprospiraceae bacterium]
MKELIFIRHAKSDWNNPLLSDINRPLGPRGLKDAPIMAARLRSLVPAVDHIVSSNTVRALETSSFFVKEYCMNIHGIESVPELYHAYPDEILHEVRNLNQLHRCVLFFGHNPGYTHLANMFSDYMIDNVPTCAFFKLEIHAYSWKEISPDNTRLTLFSKPRDDE